MVARWSLVRIFAELLSRPLAEINLESHTDLAALFSQNDPDALIDVLESFRNVPSINDRTLLFLDKIQATPEAIPALRYLFKMVIFAARKVPSVLPGRAALLKNNHNATIMEL